MRTRGEKGFVLAPLLVVQLGLETPELFGLHGPPPGLPGLLLPRPLLMIESATVALAVKLDVLVLGHGESLK